MLCALVTQASVHLTADTSSRNMAAYIKTEINKRIAEELKNNTGNHIIDLQLSANEPGTLMQKFRMDKDREMWSAEKLKEAKIWLDSFAVRSDTKCFLATVAVYNYYDTTDRRDFTYQYFKDAKSQQEEIDKADKIVNNNLLYLKMGAVDLLRACMDASDQTAFYPTDTKEKVLVYLVISYFMPPTKVNTDPKVIQPGLLYDVTLLLGSPSVDNVSKSNLVSHLKTMRGGTTISYLKHNQSREEYVAKTLQNLYRIYQYGDNAGEGYDNGTYGRDIAYTTDVIDASAPDKKEGRFKTDALTGIKDFLSKVNGTGGNKIRLVVMDKDSKNNGDILKKAEEQAKKDQTDVIEVEANESGGFMSLKYFSFKSGGHVSLCEMLNMKADIERFCDKYKIDLGKSSIYDESRVLAYICYRSLFTYIRCATNEQTIRSSYGDNYAILFMGGALHEGINYIDIFGLYEVAVSAGNYVNEKIIEQLVENTKYLLNIGKKLDDIQGFSKKLYAGDKVSLDEFRSLFPPAMVFMWPSESQLKTGLNIAYALINAVKENSANPHFHGRIAVIVIPLAITGGKGLISLVKNLRTAGMEARLTVTAEGVLARASTVAEESTGLAVRSAEGKMAHLVRKSDGSLAVIEEVVPRTPPGTILEGEGLLGDVPTILDHGGGPGNMSVGHRMSVGPDGRLGKVLVLENSSGGVVILQDAAVAEAATVEVAAIEASASKAFAAEEAAIKARAAKLAVTSGTTEATTAERVLVEVEAALEVANAEMVAANAKGVVAPEILEQMKANGLWTIVEERQAGFATSKEMAMATEAAAGTEVSSAVVKAQLQEAEMAFKSGAYARIVKIKDVISGTEAVVVVTPTVLYMASGSEAVKESLNQQSTTYAKNKAKAKTKDEDENTCKLCKTRKTICQKFDLIYDTKTDKSPGARSAIEKLCKQIASDAVLSGVGDKLLSSVFTKGRVNDFLADLISSSTNVEYLNNHVSELDSSLLSAWWMIHTYRTNNGPNLRREIEVLRNIIKLRSHDGVSSYVKDGKLRTAAGGGVVYKNIFNVIAKLIVVHCDAGPGTKSFKEELDNFIYFGDNFLSIVNSGVFLHEMLESGKKFKGGSLGMQVLRYPPGKLKGEKIVAFEEGSSSNSKHKLDQLYTNGIMVELKNWNSVKVTNKETKKTVPFSEDEKFVEQFKAYMRSIGSMNELVYIFNQRPKISEKDILEQFQLIFRDSVHQREIFRNLTANVIVELELEGLSPEERRAKIDDLIKDFKSPLYGFLILYTKPNNETQTECDSEDINEI
jgi:hypothetical protein